MNKTGIKTCELDPLPSSLLATLVDDLLSVTPVISDSLLTGSCPSVFRSAVAWPLLKVKSLDTENAKNYRSVSNLPFISKIARKSALLQLSQHLQSSNLFYPLQSAYRSGHIIETDLLKTGNDLLIALDLNQIYLLSPNDLSAVFVHRPHSAVQSQSYFWNFWHCSVLVSAIILYYLLDRTQVVSINSVYWTQVVSGCLY